MQKRRTAFVFLSLLFILSVPQFIFPQIQDSTKNSEQITPIYGYIHLGAGGSMYKVNPGNMNDLIEPFQVATALKFGYFLFLNAGFRNIFQVEYRWGKDSNNLYYDQSGMPFSFTIERTTIDMDFDYSQFLLKFNPVFYISGMEAVTVFLLWGKGDVVYLDNNDDGFKGGTKNILGLEIGALLKYFAISFSYEQNNMVFKKFAVKDFVPIESDFDASYWQLNIKFSVGFGI